MKEKGYTAFLTLVNDVSSIENTYKSNHTLEDLNLGSGSADDKTKFDSPILEALEINRRYTKVGRLLTRQLKRKYVAGDYRHQVIKRRGYAATQSPQSHIQLSKSRRQSSRYLKLSDKRLIYCDE